MFPPSLGLHIPIKTLLMLICAADLTPGPFQSNIKRQEADVCVCSIQTRHHVNSLSKDQGTRLLH